MPENNIALVDDTWGLDRHLELWLGDAGTRVTRFWSIADAIVALERERFPVVIVALRTCLGKDDGGAEHAQVPTRDCVETCAYMIRRIKKEGYPNQQTPILVADVVHPTNDGMYPNARDRLVEAGALDYCNLIEGIEPLVHKIKPLIPAR